MAQSPDRTLMILDTPAPKRSANLKRRKLHHKDCPFAFRPQGRERDYREAKAEEIRTHERCSKC
jgi:hypothetical protein